MNTNFEFLKKVDKDLYGIIEEAEKLYRDEYFEQCMTQTRKFGENVCKNVLGSRRTLESTFDQMLATLKDCITGEEQEKEFVDDLYFLKKHGNKSTHSSYVKKDGMEALECLQRAFEIAINYCAYYKNQNNVLKLRYDTELLVTGKKQKKTLAEKYQEEKSKSTLKKKTKQKTSKQQQKNKPEKQYHKMTTQKSSSNNNIFWIFVTISAIISGLILIIMSILALV